MSLWPHTNSSARTSEISIVEFRIEEELSSAPEAHQFEESGFDFKQFEKKQYHPLFRNVTFRKALVLKGYRFPHGLSFVNVTFLDQVNFAETVFDGPAYFWNCRFKHKFSFFRVLVTGKCHPVQKRAQGEVNFSYCRFDQSPELPQPSFDRAIFEGICFFHRTVFVNGVSMEETRFKTGAVFNGFRSDICVHDSQLKDLPQAVLKTLREQSPRVLSVNTDHEDHLNFDVNVRSPDSLRRALVRSLSPSALNQPQMDTGYQRMRESLRRRWRKLQSQREQWPEDFMPESGYINLLDLWKHGYESQMFGHPTAGERERISSFRFTDFGEKTHFTHVDLSSCLFQGATLSEVAFEVVTWDRQPCGLLLRRFPGFIIDLRAHPVWTKCWRYALRDELELDRRMTRVGSGEKAFLDRRTELSELYREIRIAYDNEGDSETGRDFYFGELEAERLSYGYFRRNFGLSHLYKIFSGYSKREGLALAWLLAFIFLFFPLTSFFWINWPEYRHLSFDLKKPSSSRPIGCHMVLATDSSVLNPIEKAHDVTKVPPHAQDEDDLFQNTLSGARASVWGNDTRDPRDGPLETWARNATRRSLRAITDSLQASTFYTASTEDHAVDSAIQTLRSVKCIPNYGPGSEGYSAEAVYKANASFLTGRQHRRSFLQALERLFVPAQLGLFLLALRSKFKRAH